MTAGRAMRIFQPQQTYNNGTAITDGTVGTTVGTEGGDHDILMTEMKTSNDKNITNPAFVRVVITTKRELALGKLIFIFSHPPQFATRSLSVTLHSHSAFAVAFSPLLLEHRSQTRLLHLRLLQADTLNCPHEKPTCRSPPLVDRLRAFRCLPHHLFPGGFPLSCCSCKTDSYS